MAVASLDLINEHTTELGSAAGGLQVWGLTETRWELLVERLSYSTANDTQILSTWSKTKSSTHSTESAARDMHMSGLTRPLAVLSGLH